MNRFAKGLLIALPILLLAAAFFWRSSDFARTKGAVEAVSVPSVDEMEKIVAERRTVEAEIAVLKTQVEQLRNEGQDLMLQHQLAGKGGKEKTVKKKGFGDMIQAMIQRQSKDWLKESLRQLEKYRLTEEQKEKVKAVLLPEFERVGREIAEMFSGDREFDGDPEEFFGGIFGSVQEKIAGVLDPAQREMYLQEKAEEERKNREGREKRDRDRVDAVATALQLDATQRELLKAEIPRSLQKAQNRIQRARMNMQFGRITVEEFRAAQNEAIQDAVVSVRDRLTPAQADLLQRHLIEKMKHGFYASPPAGEATREEKR